MPNNEKYDGNQTTVHLSLAILVAEDIENRCNNGGKKNCKEAARGEAPFSRSSIYCAEIIEQCRTLYCRWLVSRKRHGATHDEEYGGDEEINSLYSLYHFFENGVFRGHVERNGVSGYFSLLLTTFWNYVLEELISVLILSVTLRVAPINLVAFKLLCGKKSRLWEFLVVA